MSCDTLGAVDGRARRGVRATVDGGWLTMAPTYYQIDLSGRTLVGLVVLLALLLVLAFALGYGAAWTTLRPADVIAAPTVVPTRTPTPIPEVVVAPPDLVVPSPTLAPPVSTPTLAAPATATPRPPLPTPTPQPRRPSPTPITEPAGYWVQVIAVSHADAVADARSRLERLGFGGDQQRVLSSPVAGGSTLYKVRVGPFPDRESADRVAARMQAAGFNDSWVVAP